MSSSEVAAASKGHSTGGEKTTTASVDQQQKKAKKKKRTLLTIDLTNCKYDSVRRVARRFGMRPVGEDEEWTVYWTDTSVMLERVMDMKRYQKINHFPGMIEICRKDFLARNMNRMHKLFPKDYNVFPQSWCLPADYGDFQSYCRTQKNKTFISKPESGCQGKGIFVFRNGKDIKPGEHAVVQQYIARPFIIDGFKFDLRIYVLVTNCDPLRVYVYKDGLGRFATVKYHDPTNGNVSSLCMHLTNYAINKNSDDFVRDDDSGSKRRITTVNKWFEDNGYDLKKIWHDIDDVIIKTLIACHPILKHNYRSCFPNHNRGSACFEILGFDVLLDRKLKPWLIEVNHSPSFHTDAPLDKEVKEGLLHDTFNLVDLFANDRKKCIEEDKRRVKERLLYRQKTSVADDGAKEKYEAHLESYEKSHSGGFRRIYPVGNEAEYEKFFDQSFSLCAETAASKARSELSKQLREDVEAKLKEMEHHRRRLGPLSATSNTQGDSKNETLRPESPRVERKQSSCSGGGTSIRRRSTSFRVPAYSASRHRKTSLNDQASIVPCGEGVTPQSFTDEEELERLAGLQFRDSLVRGLGVSEQLQTMISMESKAGTRAPSAIPPDSNHAAPKSVFCTYTIYTDPGIEPTDSHSSLSSEPIASEPHIMTATDTTSLTTMPGLMYHHLSNRRSHSYSNAASKFQSTPSHSSGYKYTHGNRATIPASHQYPQLQVHQRAYLNRPQRQPPLLNLNPELFGLSVISAPIRLASRKRSIGQPGQLPPGGGGGACYRKPQPHSIQSIALSQKIKHLELLASQCAPPL